MMEGIALNGSSIVEKSPTHIDREQREEKLRKACTDFESIFIGYMFKTMRQTIPQTGFNKFPGKDIYTMMFDREVAEDFARKNRGTGLQKALFEQLNKH